MKMKNKLLSLSEISFVRVGFELFQICLKMWNFNVKGIIIPVGYLADDYAVGEVVSQRVLIACGHLLTCGHQGKSIIYGYWKLRVFGVEVDMLPSCLQCT